MRRIFFLLPAVVVAATIVQGLDVPVGAHHSEAPFYDSDKIVEIRGVVTSWVFRNPHPFLHVDVTDDKGVTNDWALEFVGPVRLIKVGWSAKTFVPGEIVSAKGHPSRAAGCSERPVIRNRARCPACLSVPVMGSSPATCGYQPPPFISFFGTLHARGSSSVFA